MNLTIINGGRGASTILPEFIKNNKLNITSIVNAYDDGKSTGAIRHFFNMLGPSDIRKVQKLMLPESTNKENLYKLFDFRYGINTKKSDILNELTNFVNTDSDPKLCNIELPQEISARLKPFIKMFIDSIVLIESSTNKSFSFNDCSIMNCIYAGAFLFYERNFEITAREIGKIFKIQGSVLPTNIEDKTLLAIRENGDVLYSEAEIVELRSNVRIRELFLHDQPPGLGTLDHLSDQDKYNYLKSFNSFVHITKDVTKAILDSDIIIFAPGTQHSSLYPTYMSIGFAEALTKSTAMKVFIVNIGADYETPSYKASDYISGAIKYLNKSSSNDYHLSDYFDFVFVNSSQKKDDEIVECDKDVLEELNANLILDNFEYEKSGKHNGKKICSDVLNLYESFQKNKL
jgi:2-phospho-L-lactate transferase/gluconeogenesis factor (CofD/UPF0052 family)